MQILRSLNEIIAGRKATTLDRSIPGKLSESSKENRIRELSVANDGTHSMTEALHENSTLIKRQINEQPPVIDDSDLGYTKLLF